MAWWALLLPAISALIYAVPYLIGGAMGIKVLDILLSSPHAMVALICAIAGFYLVYKKREKYGFILMLGAMLSFILPTFISQIGALFQNFLFLLTIVALVSIYYLGSTKQLTGKNAFIIFISLLGGVFILIGISSIAPAIGASPLPGIGGFAPPTIEYYKVTVGVEVSRPVIGKSTVEDLWLVQKARVSYCSPSTSSLSTLAFWKETKPLTVEVLRDGVLVDSVTKRLEFGWFEGSKQIQVDFCLTKGTYTIRAWSEDLKVKEIRVVL